MKRKLKHQLLAICALWLLSLSCESSKDSQFNLASVLLLQGNDVKLKITLPERGEADQPSFRKYAKASTASDIDSMCVDVKRATSTILTCQALTESTAGAGDWGVTLSNLPLETGLAFIVHAFDSSSVEIFTGMAQKTLTLGVNAITVNMKPSNDSQTLDFPRILQVARPEKVGLSQPVGVSIEFEGNTGETLAYDLSATGGSFSPATGTIALPATGTTATLETTYTSPSSSGVYDLSVRVENSAGNAVQVHTTIQAGFDQGAAISVVFNPVVMGVEADRSGSDLKFTLTMSDDKPLADLAYLWDFNGPQTFSNSTTNPATLTGYDDTVAGWLTVNITDGDGGVTTAFYSLLAGAFPDNVITDANPTIYESIKVTEALGSVGNYFGESVAVSSGLVVVG